MPEEAGKALRYSFKLLGYRGRSESELSKRLRRKGFSPRVVEKTRGRLKECGYLDDWALARSLRRKAEEVKLLGRRGAAMYLREMGIPKDVAEAALEDYDELASAVRLVENRRRKVEGLPAAVARRRLGDQLRRRGHSASTARKALEALDGKGATR
jgi:regulatory protein